MTDIFDFIKNNKLKIIVKPNSPRNEITGWDNNKNALRVCVKAEPEKGRANKEVVKFFSKLLKKKVVIDSGFKSREKIISIQEN